MKLEVNTPSDNQMKIESKTNNKDGQFSVKLESYPPAPSFVRIFTDPQ